MDVGCPSTTSHFSLQPRFSQESGGEAAEKNQPQMATMEKTRPSARCSHTLDLLTCGTKAGQAVSGVILEAEDQEPKGRLPVLGTLDVHRLAHGDEGVGEVCAGNRFPGHGPLCLLVEGEGAGILVPGGEDHVVLVAGQHADPVGRAVGGDRRDVE